MKKASPYPYHHKEPPGSTIRALREARDWSQRQLAEKAGLDHTRISGIERGQGGYTEDALQKIAKVLNVTVQDLFLPPELAHFKRLSPEIREKIQHYIAIELALKLDKPPSNEKK